MSSQTPPALPFSSRRSPVLSKHVSVATSQPLASTLGLQLLTHPTKPANAADAAIAIAAALAVLEPCSTGLGGDMFALYYDASQRKVLATNGSGRAPAALNLDVLQDAFPEILTREPPNNSTSPSAWTKSAYAVTVPGAARGWEQFLQRHGSGKYSLLELMEPAIRLAEDGFPVAPMTAVEWTEGLESDVLPKWNWEQTHRYEMETRDEEAAKSGAPFTVDGFHGPHPGDIMYNPDLANVLRSLGKDGATKGFYQGFPGREIVTAVRLHGGLMTMDDLSEELTQCTFPEPISVEYKGFRVWQIPPNGQGIAALIALKGLEALEKYEWIKDPWHVYPDGRGWKHVSHWHALIEMMRLGFADARAFVCDPDFLSANSDTPDTGWLLNEKRISNRAQSLYDGDKAGIHGFCDATSCTVSFQVVDRDGNAVSFVNSNYMGFGTGIVPKKCGFSLQNRGAGFSLDPMHPNALQPLKRPYHTIIPCMLTHADESNSLYATMSNMGGFMQPQGHLQLIVAMVECGLDPQASIDLPRFCIGDGTSDGTVYMEEGVESDIITRLKSMGHSIISNVSSYDRRIFGKAQIIMIDRRNQIRWAGSDGRSDGCAVGY